MLYLLLWLVQTMFALFGDKIKQGNGDVAPSVGSLIVHPHFWHPDASFEVDDFRGHKTQLCCAAICI